MTELEIASELEHLRGLLRADEKIPEAFKAHFYELYRRLLFPALCPKLCEQCRRELSKNIPRTE